jgi:Ser/Thr protein kinase RdoA (MazF antagonist)
MQTDYTQLTPDTVINSIESVGYWSDSRILALNSYENRVYQIGIEQELAVTKLKASDSLDASPLVNNSVKPAPLIAKFYRPNRWSDEQIIEEHQFTQQLFDLDIPVVPPLQFEQHTLLNYGGYRFSIYPRCGGHAPELDNGDHLEIIGRFIGRIHGVSRNQPFKHRPSVNIQNYAIDSRNFLLDNDFIPKDLIPAYETITRDIIDHVETVFATTPYQTVGLHGDCHPGNILWRDDRAHFVDFDDARNGPAIQDLWMLLSGDYSQRSIQIADILEGYTDFCDFDPVELNLIEPLRAMRLLHYAAWLARRWGDLAFPHNFPWFNTERYWAEHILSLREQQAVLNEPVIRWL